MLSRARKAAAPCADHLFTYAQERAAFGQVDRMPTSAGGRDAAAPDRG
jgi:hypothetical protein